MALLRRKTTTDADGRVDERGERAGTSPGLIRAIATLLGVAAALLLIWIAQAVTDGPLGDASESEYWLALALLAGAGLALGLSQLFGGWTKWGWPTLSPTVFLLGFLPTLIVGGWIALAAQPQTGTQEGRIDRWSGDIGIGGLVEDLATFLPAIPLIVGLVLAFSFDTTGPRTRIVGHDRRIPDEDVHDYRRERSTEAPVASGVGATSSDRTTGEGTSVAEEIRNRNDQTTVGRGEALGDRDHERRTTT